MKATICGIMHIGFDPIYGLSNSTRASSRDEIEGDT